MFRDGMIYLTSVNQIQQLHRAVKVGQVFVYLGAGRYLESGALVFAQRGRRRRGQPRRAGRRRRHSTGKPWQVPSEAEH